MSQTASLSLSTKGLQFADRTSRKDFRFVSNSNVFICDRFQAAFISPRIAASISTDPTIDEFSIDYADSRTFDLLSVLICGEPITIDEHNIDILESLIEDLGNEELSESVLKYVENGGSLNVSNCLSRLTRKLRIGVSVDREIEFIASHFSEFSVNSLGELEIPILKNILRFDSLRVENEDSLLELILELGPFYYGLLGDVRFELLSPSSMDRFFEQISFDELNADIWRQLWNRSRHRIVYEINDIPTHRFGDCVVKSPDSPFSGLMSYLREECGGNVHEKGMVAITASSTHHNKCWQVVNYDWNDFWSTTNTPNSWIQFDFKERSLALTHYTLKSDGNSYHHLHEWTITGSRDGNTWTQLDNRCTHDLNGDYLVKTFACNERASECQFYRYIKLTQTGKNTYGYDYLMLGNIEFFGTIANSAIGRMFGKV